MRVFISSTCYDLIDLRAEIADFFRQAGVEPVLSDDPTSDFHSKTDANSIEACLANVRSCDAFIIILSNRYGPKVNIPPYDGKSATHLEYDEAVRHGKPVWMYVRDRLDGEYTLWKRNKNLPDFEPAWVPRKDWGVFDLLECHRTLPADKQKANWFSRFKDSTQLKRILRQDFAALFARAVAEKLFENGRVPFLEISGGFNSFTSDGSSLFRLQFANLSAVPAIAPVFSIKQKDAPSFSGNIHPFQSIPNGGDIMFPFTWVNHHWNQELQWSLTYSILEGHQFEDSGSALIKPPSTGSGPQFSLMRTKRRYLQADMGMVIDAPAT